MINDFKVKGDKNHVDENVSEHGTQAWEKASSEDILHSAEVTLIQGKQWKLCVLVYYVTRSFDYFDAGTPEMTLWWVEEASIGEKVVKEVLG